MLQPSGFQQQTDTAAVLSLKHPTTLYVTSEPPRGSSVLKEKPYGLILLFLKSLKSTEFARGLSNVDAASYVVSFGQNVQCCDIDPLCKLFATCPSTPSWQLVQGLLYILSAFSSLDQIMLLFAKVHLMKAVPQVNNF